jgi:hypothetical protein
MATPIEDYRNAAIEHKAAAERAKQIVERVHKGAEILQQWKSVIVADIAGAGFPEEIGLARKATEFDGANWPTGEQVAEALSAYHATRQRVFDRYDAIPKPEQFVIHGPHRICGHDPWQFDHKGRWRGTHGMRVAVRQFAQRARQLIPMRHPSVVRQALVFEVPARIFSQSKRSLNFSKAIWRDAVARMSAILGRVATIGGLVFGVPARIFSQSQRLFRIGNGRAEPSHGSQPPQIARQSVESPVQPVGQHRLAHSAQSFDFDLVESAFEKRQEKEALWAAFWMVIFAVFFVLVILSGFTFG